jgi:hypothetical protein
VEPVSRTFHLHYMKDTMTIKHHSTISEYQVIRAIRLFRFVKREQLEMYFRGRQGRIKALEILLPVLERKGRITAVWHKGEKVYSPAGRIAAENFSLEHDVAATDILIRLWRCRMVEGEIVTERTFRGFAVVADGGVRFDSRRKTMLIFEYCTNKNFNHGGVAKSKITRYRKYMVSLEKHFERAITVLFVIDDHRQRVADYVRRNQDLLTQPVASNFKASDYYPFFFTDYQTFKNAPVGEALGQKIYFWVDGKEWCLAND